jgi:uncharacterized membrane protein YoaK (UPF0700 family)
VGVPSSQPSAKTDQAAASTALRAILVGLTFSSGLVDALSFLGMGHVFVANMTGNVVFLGFAVAGASGLSESASLAALAAFLVGALVGGRIGASLSGRRRAWLVLTSGIQAVLVVVAAAASAAGALSPVGGTRLVIVVLLGLGMGVQNATARRLAVPDLTTTVLTLTLTGMAADSIPAGGDSPRPLRRLSAVVAMFAGALAGAVLELHAGFDTAIEVTAAAFVLVCVTLAVLPLEERELSPGSGM